PRPSGPTRASPRPPRSATSGRPPPTTISAAATDPRSVPRRRRRRRPTPQFSCTCEADTEPVRERSGGRRRRPARAGAPPCPGGRAAESARAADAAAYTVGRHVVFGAGRYRPETDEGRRLVAHELAHLAQQRAAAVEGGPIRVGDPAAPAEREADRAATRLVE